MRIQTQPKTNGGYALLMTCMFVSIGLIYLAATMRRNSSEATMTIRHNLHTATVAAAEAATEMVLAQMDRDFVYQSVNSDLSIYSQLTPSSLQSNWPIQFAFSDAQGNANLTRVESLGPTVVTNLDSEFTGLYGLVMPYRVTAQAEPVNQRYAPAAAVRQDIQLASIPIFQYAIFYGLDLEINPGPKMVITGKVHGNANIYTAPVTGLQYNDDVTAVGKIYNSRHPDDPAYGSGKVAPVYKDVHMEKVSALTLPLGTDNSPESVHQVIEPPPSSENPNSDLGKQRLYNKADLIVTTTDTDVQVTCGNWNLFSSLPPDVTNSGVASYSFIRTDPSFNDLRELSWTTTTELDVGALKTWITNKAALTDNALRLMTGHGINSIYINDQRSSPSRLTVVRVVNGQYLPSEGLTVATQLPLYVKGHFNAPTPGSTNTSNTKPAALIGDAITILSSSWDDSNAGKALNKRPATDTTVNAALMGGIVKTVKQGGNKYYSGGVENFPRFLEDWDGDTLTYNGSMVVMFESTLGNHYWQATGNYYNPPIRKWAFDVNFLNQEKLPPCTPQVRKLVRGQWRTITPYGS